MASLSFLRGVSYNDCYTRLDIMIYRRGITFGAFDPLHYGHIRLFERAKTQCDSLIVCVSDLGYINENKGRSERVPFEERLKAVASIRYVDIVDVQSLLFGKKEAVAKYNPDVIFVGDDWAPETFTGENLGIPVLYLPHTKGINSSRLSEIS